MTIQPQTTYQRLMDEMSDIQEQGKLLPPDSATALALRDRLDKLESASQQQALFLRGVWYMICGDALHAIACLRDVCEVDFNPQFHIFCVLANLGYATDGLVAYRAVGSPLTGDFTFGVPGGISVGALRTIASFISQAETMHLSNLDGVPVDELRTADRILDVAGTEDEDVARVLTVAGATMREHGLVFLGDVGVDASEASGTVTLRYGLAITPDEASWLHDQFLDRLYDEDVPVPHALSVVFEGRRGDGWSPKDKLESCGIRL